MKYDFLKMILNFIPILLVFLLASYTDDFVSCSHTILGKAFAVILILFYVNVDLIAGLLVCVLIVFYYQTDYVESYTDMKETLYQGVKEEEKEEVKDTFQEMGNAYPEQYIKKDTIALKTFRETYCKNGHLIHKEQKVKPEILEHIFPQLQQSDYYKCNICDPACSMEITDNRVKNEYELQAPKDSNELFDKVWKNLYLTSSQETAK
jgi:hypothetical protein